MPEEKDTKVPETVPVERPRRLSPTVINPAARGGLAKPGKRSQPTIIEGGEAAPPKRDRLRPEAPALKQPTVVPGVARVRIPVAIGDLRKISPGANSEVLESALRLIETEVIDQESERTAILWGQRLQQDYSDLVSRTLSLTQADVLKRAAGYVSRMMEILGSIDLAAVSGATVSGGIGQYIRKMTRRIDTPEELDRARTELDQLLKLMSSALDGLLALKQEIERTAREAEETGDRAEAAAVAAEFLSGHLRRSKPELSQRFLERGMSLTQTAVQIRSSSVARKSQIEQPLRLVSAIQNVALVMMPGWLGGIASLTGLARGRNPTPTEAGELTYQLQNILRQLQD